MEAIPGYSWIVLCKKTNSLLKYNPINKQNRIKTDDVSHSFIKNKTENEKSTMHICASQSWNHFNNYSV